MHGLSEDSHSCMDKGNLRSISLDYHEVRIQRAWLLPIFSAISSPISDCSRNARRGAIKKLIKGQRLQKMKENKSKVSNSNYRTVQSAMNDD